MSNPLANNLGTFLGSGHGTFALQVAHPTGRVPFALAAGDVNRDGHADLVTTIGQERLAHVLLGNGDGTFRDAPTSPFGGDTTNAVLDDFDRDGILDLAGAGYNTGPSVDVAFGVGDGTFHRYAAHAFAPPGQPTAAGRIASGDVERDGCSDVLTTSGGYVVLLPGRCNGDFALARSFALGLSSLGLAVGDLDGDGLLDVVAAGGGHVSVLLGEVHTTLDSARLFPGPSYAGFVTLADVNGDGQLDVLTADSSGNTVSVMLNTTR